jgi:hypothetical protein
MLFSQVDPVSVQLDQDNILMIGGGVQDQNGNDDLEKSFRATQIYNIPEDRFYFAGSMHFSRTSQHCYTVTRLKDGRVLIIGGENYYTGKAISEIEIFNPKNRTFQIVPSISIPRINHTATLLPDGKVLIAGGYTQEERNEPGQNLSSALLFDPINNTIKNTKPMVMPMEFHSSVLLDNHRVLLVGGREDTARAACISHAEYYDIQKNAFFELPNMNNVYCKPNLLLLSNGNILIMSKGQSAIESFNRNTNRFSSFFSNPYFAADPVLLDDNSIFFAMAGPPLEKKYPWGSEDRGYSELIFLKENHPILIGPMPNRPINYSSTFISKNRVYTLGGVTSKPFGKAKLPVYMTTGYYINIPDLTKLKGKAP